MPNNIKSVKKNFDEVINQFQKALQCSNDDKSEMQYVPNKNVITSDKAAESKSNHVDYNNATQDNKDQGEKSTESLVVSSNADDRVVLCPVDGNDTNNVKDENETTYGGSELPSQEQMEVDESANVATFAYVSDLSDEESAPKKSKQFTFTDSDLPDSDEIREILMLYPKPPIIETDSEGFNSSELESSSEDESNWPICRRRYKSENTKVDFNKMFEVLPERIIVRQRKQPDRYGFEDSKMVSNILKPRYLVKQEDQISADIIIENMKRLKKMRKRNTDKDSQNQNCAKEKKKEHLHRKKVVNKSNQHKTNIKTKIKKYTKRRNAKSKFKSNSRKSAELKINNTKEDSLGSSAAETTSRRTRTTKNKTDVEKTQHNSKILGKRNQKIHCLSTNKKERVTLVENKRKRSKRQQTTKEPLADGIDVPSPKRMRTRNTNNNQEANNNNSSRTCNEFKQDKRVPYVYLIRYLPPQKPSNNMDSKSNLLNMETRRQSARRRLQRTKDETARR